MKFWMCERLFEVTVEGEAMVVTIRFTVEAATKAKARRLAEAESVAAFRAVAGGAAPVVPSAPAAVLYPL